MEYWDIYDKDGHFTGRKKGKYEKWGEDEYHLATEGWIINSNKQILVQQRIISGENTREGCVREFREELGIHIDKDECKLVKSFMKNRLGMIWDIYFIRKDVNLDELVLQEEEVARAKFVNTNEFREMLKEGIMCEYEEIYELLDIIDNLEA